MTRRHFALGVVALVILVGSAFAWRAWAKWSAVALPPVGVAAAQPEPFDPDAPGIFNIERRPPPPSATLGDMLRAADAVLVVQLRTDVTERHVTQLRDLSVVQPRTPMESLAGVGPVVAVPRLADYRTIYSFMVKRAIKGAMRWGDTVRIAREGGRQTFEDDFPRPGVGEEFVVFLKWWPEVGAYRQLARDDSERNLTTAQTKALGNELQLTDAQRVEADKQAKEWLESFNKKRK